MFEYVIGCQTLGEEMAEKLKELGEFDFPRSVFVENLMPFPLVDSSIKPTLVLDSNLKANGVSRNNFTFPTYGHLLRFCDNVLTLTKLNNFDSGLAIYADIDKEAEQPEQQQDEPQAEAEQAEEATSTASSTSRKRKTTKATEVVEAVEAVEAVEEETKEE